MPEGNKGKESFQGRLKGFLVSIAPGVGEARARKAAGAEQDGLAGPQHVQLESFALGKTGGALGQPGYEVEIIPPETGSSRASGDPISRGSEELQSSKTSESQQAAEALLEGMLEILVVSPVSPARLLSFERALKERDGVRWLGTWGRPKEGTVLRLQMTLPVPAVRLFEGAASVERAEMSKAGEVWRLSVSLAPEAGDVPAVEIPSAGASPSPEPPQQPEPAEQETSPAYLGPVGQAASESTDIEVSPIASLDSLTRFERLLGSLSASCRVLNVLSLDGVSTVLITLEGIDGDALARGLQDSVRGIKLDAGQGRLVARLPDKW